MPNPKEIPMSEQPTYNPGQTTDEIQANVAWDSPTAKISQYFSVREATYLPSWQVYHKPNEEEKRNILAHAKKMDAIRDMFGVALKIHCWIRPDAVNAPGSVYHMQNYNKSVKGAPGSTHRYGLATDFDVFGQSCDDVRKRILDLNKLDELELRMEDAPGSDWVHLDSGSLKDKRFFKP